MTSAGNRRRQWWFWPLVAALVVAGPASGVLLALGTTRHNDALLVPGAILLGLLLLNSFVIIPVARGRQATQRRGAPTGDTGDAPAGDRGT